VIAALLCGAGVGTGLFLMVRGMAPPRPSLAEALAQLRRMPEPTSLVVARDSGGFAHRMGRPLAEVLLRAGAGVVIWPRVRRDLAVLGRNTERHLAEKVTLAIVGLLLVPACAALLSLAGATLPVALPLWGSLVGAVAGFVLPDLGIHAARLARDTPWSALERLGDELGVAELGELAASVGLAGAEGAKVRASLGAKASSLRSHQLAEAETTAQAATEKMSLPVVLLFAGFLCFIGYPAVERVLTGL